MIPGEMSSKRRPSDAELQTIPIFDEVDGPDFSLLQRFAEVVNYPAGMRMFGEGAPGDAMFFLLKGEVNIMKESVTGEKVLLATLGKGNVLGEMSLVDNAPRSATAVAKTDIELIVLTKESFLNLVESHPRPACKIMLKLMRTLSLRLRQVDSKVADIKK